MLGLVTTVRPFFDFTEPTTHCVPGLTVPFFDFKYDPILYGFLPIFLTRAVMMIMVTPAGIRRF